MDKYNFKENLKKHLCDSISVKELESRGTLHYYSTYWRN